MAADYTQGGYADRTSVVQGGTIRFSIATAVAPFALTIVNLARPTQVLRTITGLTAPPRDCTGLWETGCGWPVTTSLTIPSSWPSGYYAARFPIGGGQTRNVIFVVKAAVPGSTSPMVIVSTTNTYTAYNPFGGKSVYDFNSTGRVRAATVSFARPYDDNEGLSRFPAWEQQFVDWLTAEGRSYEVIADDDLESPTALANYKVVVLVGHSEYWTLRARSHVEAFVAAGGHLAVFSGNTMWWQARLDSATRQFTCYKNGTADPMAGVNDAVVTTNFFARPVYNPENTILGASFRHAEYANLVAPGDYELAPVEQRTPYTVRDASSWVFDGTGVVTGQQIAQATGGFEVDGVTFNTTAGGALKVDGSDGTPLNFQILATLPAELGYGVIGLYTHPGGGTVFNAATQSWSHGLASDAIVQQMTRNVLNRLSTGAPLPYVRVESPYLSEDLFNTPSPQPGVLQNWDGGLGDAAISARCAYEGARGLELKGTEWLELRRDFSPFNNGRSAVEASFAINLDLLQQTASWPLPLVQLAGRGPSAIVYAVVEVQLRPAGKSIRLSTFRADGSSTSSTAWRVLSPGWHTVRASWRSPGAVALQVDAQPALEAFNAESGQTVHDLFLAFPGTGYDAVGSICIDALRVVDGGCDPALVTGQPQSKTIAAGSSTTLSVTASGTTPLSYQWFAGTSPIGGATDTSLTVAPTTTTSYFVRVTNGCGTTDSATATVTVCNPATITGDPQSVTIPSGSSTTLSATASGTAPLSYQWFAGTTAINGATSNSVTVSPTATTTYFVRVTNSCGTDDSAPATVT
ncbi:MAG TPA: N,N-dimethylformamidase beta subunit family domain-containing protein, partial [Thermoanaerobaculia bacterium]